MEMDRYIGRLLDNRYEILEVIGTGGMAVVYKARCHRLNRLVAVKILKDDFFRDEEFRRRFHAESQAVAMLSHPNIVSVYDVAASDEADYIVMELIDGITLKQYLEIRGVLNWKETLHFAIQIGKALDHAHSRGIVHRDIKPHNVMVLKNGSVKVTDFGIARVMSNSNSLTKEALGSVHYISPEQAKGGHVDNRSDLYSLGVVMYEMMTGKPPYDGESPVAIAIQHINGNYQAPSVLNPSIPGGLEQIIMRAMEQNPAKRFASAAKMLYDMDEFRKDPAILFDYNNPVADMDAAINLQSPNQDKREPAPQPKVVPARAPGGGTTNKRRPPAPAPAPRKPVSRRPKEEIVEEEPERGSRVATIAIVACVVAIVLALVVIVIWGLGGMRENMIEVPSLLGMTEEEAKNLPYLNITVSSKKASSEYPAGQIMSQNPAAGTQIAKGGKITVVISTGTNAKTGIMADLSDTLEADATKYLNGQGLNLQIVPKRENSSTVEEGHIIRTEPAKNETLTEGQIVYLYISTGPDIRMSNIPSKIIGLDVQLASGQLNSRGFLNVEFEMVDSDEDKNMVVGMNVQEGATLDVTTEIILYVSKGKGTTTDPTDPTDPTEQPPSVFDPTLISAVVTVQLPENMGSDYTLSIWKGTTLVEEIKIPAGAISRDVELTGKGIVTFDFKIGELLVDSVTVDFSQYAEDESTTETYPRSGR